MQTGLGKERIHPLLKQRTRCESRLVFSRVLGWVGLLLWQALLNELPQHFQEDTLTVSYLPKVGLYACLLPQQFQQKSQD